jgi:hypothetical protein
MTEDLAKEIAALKKRLEELEAKAQMKPEPPLVRKEPFMPHYDPTEGMTMGAGMKPMVNLINPKAKYDPDAWRRNSPSQPSGMGPPKGGFDKGPTKVRAEEELKIEQPPKSWWNK